MLSAEHESAAAFGICICRVSHLHGCSGFCFEFLAQAEMHNLVTHYSACRHASASARIFASCIHMAVIQSATFGDDLKAF